MSRIDCTPEPNVAENNTANAAQPTPSSTHESDEAPVVRFIKRRRARVRRPDLQDQPVDRMCVQICDFLNCMGSQITLSRLRRGLSSYRRPDIFAKAIRRLRYIGAIELKKQKGTRLTWVFLMDIPEQYTETAPRPKKQRFAPQSRGRTPWFEKLI